MLVCDLKYNLGSIQDSFGRVGTVTNAKFSQKEKGWALETSNGAYVQYSQSLLPQNSFSVVVWARIKNSHIISSDRSAIIADQTSASNLYFALSFNATSSFIALGTSNYRNFTYTPDKYWHCFILTVPGSAQSDISSSQFFVDGVSKPAGSTYAVGGQSARSSWVYVGGSNTTTGGALISRIKVYDTVLDQNSIDREQMEFMSAGPLSNPKRGFIISKPSDLSRFKGSGAGQGLVGAWNMIPRGNTLVDVSGNGYNGTLSGGVVNTKNGLSFKNSKSLITLNTYPSQLGDITIMCRVRIDSSGGSGFGRIFYTTNGNPGFSLMTPSEVLQFSRNTTTYSSSGSIQLGQWITVVITSTSNGVSNFYINGILSGNANQASGTPSSGPLYIGNNTAFNRNFDGEIADIRIYNNIQSLQQIKSYHNSFIRPTLLVDFSDCAVLSTI